MTRPDTYDYIGMALAVFIVALWVAHFVLPTPPPDPQHSANPPLQALPSTPPR
jgi:hypothetical protein